MIAPVRQVERAGKPDVISSHKYATRTMQHIIPTSDLLLKKRAILIMRRQYQAHFVKGVPVGRTHHANTDTIRRHGGIGEVPSVSQRGNATIFDAITFKLTTPASGRPSRRHLKQRSEMERNWRRDRRKKCE